MVAHRPPAVIAAVEPHLRRVRALRCGVDFSNLPEADDFGPELVRFLHVTHIEDEMIEADWGNGSTLRRHVQRSLHTAKLSLWIAARTPMVQPASGASLRY